MKKKIWKAMKEKGLFDPIDAVIEPLFTKEVLEYPNLRKLKPSAIGTYKAPNTQSIMFKHSNHICIMWKP